MISVERQKLKSKLIDKYSIFKFIHRYSSSASATGVWPNWDLQTVLLRLLIQIATNYFFNVFLLNKFNLNKSQPSSFFKFIHRYSSSASATGVWPNWDLQTVLLRLLIQIATNYFFNVFYWINLILTRANQVHFCQRRRSFIRGQRPILLSFNDCKLHF